MGALPLDISPRRDPGRRSVPPADRHRSRLRQAEDGELVELAQAGGEAALEELLNRHYGRILAVTRRSLGGSDGYEDAAQNAILSVARKIGTFDNQAKFTTWIHRIAVNAALDEGRRRSRSTSAELHDEVVDRTRPFDEQLADRDSLTRALSALSEQHRTVLALRELAEFDYGEIADHLSIPVGTVRSRLARARLELSRVLRTNAPANDVELQQNSARSGTEE